MNFFRRAPKPASTAPDVAPVDHGDNEAERDELDAWAGRGLAELEATASPVNSRRQPTEDVDASRRDRAPPLSSEEEAPVISSAADRDEEYSGGGESTGAGGAYVIEARAHINAPKGKVAAQASSRFAMPTAASAAKRASAASKAASEEAAGGRVSAAPVSRRPPATTLPSATPAEGALGEPSFEGAGLDDAGAEGSGSTVYRAAPAGTGDESVAEALASRDARIADLSRRNRMLSVDLDKERARSSRLSSQVAAMREQLATAQVKATIAAANAAAAAALGLPMDAQSATAAVKRTKSGVAFGAGRRSAAAGSAGGEGAGDGASEVASQDPSVTIRNLSRLVTRWQGKASKLERDVTLLQRAVQAELGPDVPLQVILSAHGIAATSSAAYARPGVGAAAAVRRRGDPASSHAPSGSGDSAEGMEGPPEEAVEGDERSAALSPARRSTAVEGGSPRSPRADDAPAASAAGAVAGGGFKGGDWRGRAQQIVLLKARVRALELQVRELGGSVLPGKGGRGFGDAGAEEEAGEGSGAAATSAAGAGVAAGKRSASGAPSDAELGLGLGPSDDEGDASKHKAGGSKLGAAAGSGDSAAPAGKVAGAVTSRYAQRAMAAATSGKGAAGAPVDVDGRAEATVKALEQRNFGKLAALQSDCDKLKAEADAARQKASAASVRVSVLEGDVRRLKGQLTTVLGKGETDERLIDALKAEVRNARTLPWGAGRGVRRSAQNRGASRGRQCLQYKHAGLSWRPFL